MSEYQFSFERLEVWQLARKLSKVIYDVTLKFPSEEKYGLVSQIRRSAVSVCSNIAEGSARKTANDKAYFTTIAYSSLMELCNQLILSNDLQWINEQEMIEIKKRIQNLSVKLNNLRNSQLNLK